MSLRSLIFVCLLGVGSLYAMEIPEIGSAEFKKLMEEIIEEVEDNSNDPLEDLDDLEGTRLEDAARHAENFFGIIQMFFPAPNNPQGDPNLKKGLLEKIKQGQFGLLDLMGSVKPVSCSAVNSFKKYIYQKLRDAKDNEGATIENVPERLNASFSIILGVLAGGDLSQAGAILAALWGQSGAVFVKEFASDNLGCAQKWILKKIDDNKQSKGIAFLRIILPFVEKAIGRKQFPILDDAQLGDCFTENDWSLMCAVGNTRVIKHFLEEEIYAHLLNQPVGANRALDLAAFGYLNGKLVDGIKPSLEGFRLLAQDPRIASNYKIKAGFGLVDFDEWLLQDASYDKPKQQQRLEEIKAILRPTLSPERQAILQIIQDRKDADRQAEEDSKAQKRMNFINKTSFFAGLVLTVGVLYYYFNNQADAANTTQRVAIK